jgi:hypothetical protein
MHDRLPNIEHADAIIGQNAREFAGQARVIGPGKVQQDGLAYCCFQPNKPLVARFRAIVSWKYKAGLK